MPKPKEPKPVDSLAEKGDRLLAEDEPDLEAEVLRGYYPHLNPNVKPREWDEHK